MSMAMCIVCYAALRSVTSSCPILCDPIDRSPPGSSVHEILQTRIVEWAAISSSRGSSWPKDWTHASCISWISRWIIYHWATWEAWPYTQCSIIEVIIYTSTFPRFQIFRLLLVFFLWNLKRIQYLLGFPFKWTNQKYPV